MSWSPELFIGGIRPWPDSVHVVRSRTDEMRRYMPEPVRHEGETNWDRLFGTPEKASKVLVALNTCRVVGCEDCAAREVCMPYSDFVSSIYDDVLEWLESEAEQ